ncbi:MAG: hypothetical protein V3U76_14065 [Granulosicoccus sp.]
MKQKLHWIHLSDSHVQNDDVSDLHAQRLQTLIFAPSIARQFFLWPGQQEHAETMDSHIGFHYVTFDASGTRIQYHSVEFK